MPDEYDHLRESADADHLCGRATCRHHFDHHSINNPGCGCGIEGCPGREPTVLDSPPLLTGDDWMKERLKQLPFVDVEVTGTEIEFPKKSQVGTPKELTPSQRYQLGNIHHVLLGLTGMVESLIEDVEESLSFSPPDYTEPEPGNELLVTILDALSALTPHTSVYTILEANKK